MLPRLRRFALTLAFVQLLIALVGFTGRPAQRETRATIDVVLESASIARLPDRTVEASKPHADDGATVPSGIVVPDADYAFSTFDIVVLRSASRPVSAPRARAPPHRA